MNQKSGWVYKQGGVTGNAWKKKYAVLQYNLLLVFDSEEDAAKKMKPKHTYNVSDAIIRPIEGMHKFGFQVQISNDNQTKSINMAALDSQGLKDWTEGIKEAAKPAPVVKPEEKKIPGRWDPPAQPKPAVSPSNPGGNVVVQSPSPVMAHPQPVMTYAQPQQMPVQQVPAQQAPPQQGPPQYNYNQYMGQQYQPQVQYQYQQQQFQAPPPQYQQQPYQPQYQQAYQPPPQQYQQPQYQQPQYQPQQPQYQPQQPQYQQSPQQAPYQPQPSQPNHFQQLNSLISQAPSAPTSAPVAFPSTPTEQPKTQTSSTSSMFPHLSQLQ